MKRRYMATPSLSTKGEEDPGTISKSTPQGIPTWMVPPASQRKVLPACRQGTLRYRSFVYTQMKPLLMVAVLLWWRRWRRRRRRMWVSGQQKRKTSVFLLVIPGNAWMAWFSCAITGGVLFRWRSWYEYWISIESSISQEMSTFVCAILRFSGVYF